jgi:hypothetical protein
MIRQLLLLLAVASAASAADAPCVFYDLQPHLLTHITTPGGGSACAPYGTGYVVIADGAMGVQVVDVSDPGSPAPVGSVALAGYAHEVAFVGSHA